MPDPIQNPGQNPGRSSSPSAPSSGAPQGPRTGPLSKEEFAALFQASARMLWTIAAGVLGSPTEADDVLQEACIQALGKLERFERGTSFSAWMGRFVRNVALNHARKHVRRQAERTGSERGAPLDELPAHSADEHTPIDEVGLLQEDQSSFDDRLMAELKEIAAVPRACLLLRSLLELSYAEISEALEIPEGTAMSHVHRTRNLLKQRLSRELPIPRTGEVNGHARIRLVDATVNDGRSTVDAETRS